MVCLKEMLYLLSDGNIIEFSVNDYSPFTFAGVIKVMWFWSDDKFWH